MKFIVTSIMIVLTLAASIAYAMPGQPPQAPICEKRFVDGTWIIVCY